MGWYRQNLHLYLQETLLWDKRMMGRWVAPQALCEGTHQPRDFAVDQPPSLLGPRPLWPEDHRVVSRATESLQGTGPADPRSRSCISSASCSSLHACARAHTHTHTLARSPLLTVGGERPPHPERVPRLSPPSVWQPHPTPALRFSASVYGIADRPARAESPTPAPESAPP